MKFRFGGGMEFLPTLEDEESLLLEVWESGSPAQRKEFERDLEINEPESFQHFKDHILVNHPEYEP